MPVDALMKNWVTQPGFPVITASRNGDMLTLKQRRFTYLPVEADQKWLVPVTVTAFAQDGRPTILNRLMDQADMALALPPGTAAYKVNAEQTGFYHTCYTETENMGRLGHMIRNGKLSILDRWGIQNDLFAMVRAGIAPMADFLEMADNYLAEQAYLPLSSLDSHLYEAFLVLGGDVRARVASKAESLAGAALKALGEVPAPNEAPTAAMLRDQLLVQRRSDEKCGDP